MVELQAFGHYALSLLDIWAAWLIVADVNGVMRERLPGRRADHERADARRQRPGPIFICGSGNADADVDYRSEQAG